MRQDLVTATAASSIIACFIMGAGANMPLALAPGWGTHCPAQRDLLLSWSRLTLAVVGCQDSSAASQCFSPRACRSAGCSRGCSRRRMGLNAYFASSVVGYRGTGNVPYQEALAGIFVEGWLFVILAITGIRAAIIKLVPR